jgi:glycine betaine transporter
LLAVVVIAVVVIAVLAACFVLSAVSGVHRGVKYLSNANAIAAALLAFFLFVVGPSVFILGTFTDGMGSYLTQLPHMSFTTGVYDGKVSTWLNGWTVFYWAWWISWTPFVGMFIARISKGRTIRQFVIYVILIPSMVSFVWFAILGGAAINLQLNEGWNPPRTETGSIALEASLFETLRQFPLSGITVALAVFLVAIFFVTGADSASIVMAMLSRRGAEQTRRPLVVFWGLTTGAVAAVLLWAGGLSALQTLVILVAGPFLLVLIGMCVSLLKALRTETFESRLPSRVRGAVEHAERFKDGP